jgi:ubiquinone/menaquinone biosynthesis C-methylase UbiE
MMPADMDTEIKSSVVEDCWFRWLNHGRDGGDGLVRSRVAAETAVFAEKILDLAHRQPGYMLDIGSGTGLMAWAALSRWPDTHVTMTDISPPLLAQAAAEATRRGLARQCRFLSATAETLEGAADASQDLVTSRSVLAYVADKLAAFRAAFRILRPGGTLCIAEPLLRDEALTACALRTARADAANPMAGLLHKWKAAQFPDTYDAIAASPMTNYTERELFNLARQAGFEDVHLELHIDERRIPPREWEGFCAMAPHPLAPSLDQILSSEFTPAERELFETAMRPVVERGEFGTTARMVYLRADKPQ